MRIIIDTEKGRMVFYDVGQAYPSCDCFLRILSSLKIFTMKTGRSVAHQL